MHRLAPSKKDAANAAREKALEIVQSGRETLRRRRARKEYRSRNRRSQARAAIPEAWRELVEKPSPRDAAVSFQPQRDELLVELLASAVESKAGVRAVFNGCIIRDTEALEVVTID